MKTYCSAPLPKAFVQLPKETPKRPGHSEPKEQAETRNRRAISPFSPLSILPVALALALAFPAAAELSGPTRVGDLGRKEALVFEGNRTFPSAQIIQGLRRELEYFVVSHPDAPLSGYVTALERLVSAGYKHNGFPEPRVNATVDTTAERIRVAIQEGPRYKTGPIRFQGVKAIEDRAVQQQLTDALAGLATPGSGTTDTNQLVAMWVKDGYAPFDENATSLIAERLRAELAALQFYNPQLKVSIVPDATTKSAELIIEMADEGLRGTVAQISVVNATEEHTNTADEVVEYLGLKEGMQVSPALLGDVTNRLYESGRFVFNDAVLVPQPEVGKFKLEVRLEEALGVPPLRQPLSTNEAVFLKLANWLSNLHTQREDLTFQFQTAAPRTEPVALEMVISPSGLALAARQVPSNTPPRLVYGLVLSTNGIRYYSGWRQRKLLTPPGKKIKMVVELKSTGTTGEKNNYNLFMGGGISSYSTDPPVDLKLNFAPVKFLDSAQAAKKSVTLKDGILHAAFAEPGTDLPAQLQIDAATGQLVDLWLEVVTNGVQCGVRLQGEAGGYQRLENELSAATSSWKDEYVQGCGFSSWAGFLLSDLLESGLIESAFVSNLTAAAAHSPKNAAALVSAAARIRNTLAQFKTAVGKPDLIQCLIPFEQKLAPLWPKASAKEEDQFALPRPETRPQSQMQALMTVVGTWIIDKADEFWQPDSWPWTLTREACFTAAGQNQYTQTELDKLLTGQVAGPLGSGAAGALVAAVNAPLAEKFVRRSLDQLTAAGFEKDLEVVLAPDTMAGQVLGQMLAGFSEFKEPQLDALGSILGGTSSNFLRQAALVLRDGQSPAQALRPPIEKFWDPLLKPLFEAKLKDLLAKVGPPSNPADACKRAEFILSTAQKPADRQTAVELFRKNAQEGYAPAQFRLARLYEEGKDVPRDFAEAFKWYRGAADQNFPHAACRVADLYFNGEGVERNVETALSFYAREASNKCAQAQLRLAQCLEQQSKALEAIDWYRQAATNGVVAAQMALGDRLTDALTCPVNNTEACFWYSVAAESGNRVAAVSARRLKSKLSTEDQQSIEKEVTRLVARLREKAAEDR